MLPWEATVAVALWILHAHAFDASAISPRLVITSPEKRCGKTTLLRVIHGLVPKALAAANITAAAVFRTVEKVRPTLLIDEADTFLAESEELRGVLNSGHCRDGQVIRLVGDGHDPRAFSTWCPTVIAAIGKVSGTIEDRSILVRMRRRRPDETISRLCDDKTVQLPALARQARRWTDDRRADLSRSDPLIPPELNDRAADNWRPLLAIADQARGGWERWARSAAVKLSAEGATDQESMRTLLLADVREAYRIRSTDRMSSGDIVVYLTRLDDRPWSELSRGKPMTKNTLARFVKPFGIKSGTIRLDGDRTAKGYYLAAFDDAFARYLPPQTVTT
jgi:hypothetical protein